MINWFSRTAFIHFGIKSIFIKTSRKLKLNQARIFLWKFILKSQERFRGRMLLTLLPRLIMMNLSIVSGQKAWSWKQQVLTFDFLVGTNKRKTSVIFRENDSVNVFCQSLWNTSLFKTNEPLCLPPPFFSRHGPCGFVWDSYSWDTWCFYSISHELFFHVGIIVLCKLID